ncbi:hypothetical protein ACF1AB_39375 [Streptomyces sp. NPDC014846]|uniref:hypothetical protein n=1 Tax=Streptomyces sp. NPDC014846 TaxID=3364922 RepID=UPI0036F4ED01
MEQLDFFAAAEQNPVPATFAARPRPTPAPALAAVDSDPGESEASRREPPSLQARIPAPHRPTPLLVGSPRDAGQRLGEAVAETWHASNWAGSRIDIPVSNIGGLALFPIKGHTQDVTRIITESTDYQLLQGYREIYAHTWARRPDLGARMAPLMSWLTEDGAEEKAYAVRRVTETALRYGILHLTGDPDPHRRASTDVMSWTIMSLRSHGARRASASTTPRRMCAT